MTAILIAISTIIGVNLIVLGLWIVVHKLLNRWATRILDDLEDK